MKVAEEADARLLLATAWQILGRTRLVDCIFNHISVSFGSGNVEGFVMNNPAFLATEASPSSAIRVDLQGQVCENGRLNEDGKALHLAVHRRMNADFCLVHLHTEATTVLSCLDLDLSPVTQVAMEFVDDVVRVPYTGLLRTGTESIETVATIVSRGEIALLENHGFVVGAENVAEVVYLAYYFDEACRHILNLSGMAPRAAMIAPSRSVVMETAAHMRADRPHAAKMLFEALKRSFGL